MQKEAEKFVDSSVMEGMFSIRAILRAAEDGINDRKIEKILFDKNKKKSKAHELAFLRAKSANLGFEIEFVDAEKLEEITIGNSHGGIVALCTDRTIGKIENMNIRENGFYVMLEGIEDPYNFGYCLRSLYAAGVDGILVGERNWFSAAGVVSRASAGASELFEIAAGEPTELIDVFRKKGYTVIAADKTEDAVPVYDTKITRPVLLVVGGEKRGITRAVLEKCDKVVCLDYGRRFGAALSAASAASILAFEIFRQNRDTEETV
ncbi:MAG: RNA methyltransferase [Clostridia bacterium]|nr:RNA methyltransferase [Clostridia bacterium]